MPAAMKRQRSESHGRRYVARRGEGEQKRNPTHIRRVPLIMIRNRSVAMQEVPAIAATVGRTAQAGGGPLVRGRREEHLVLMRGPPLLSHDATAIHSDTRLMARPTASDNPPPVI